MGFRELPQSSVQARVKVQVQRTSCPVRQRRAAQLARLPSHRFWSRVQLRTTVAGVAVRRSPPRVRASVLLLVGLKPLEQTALPVRFESLTASAPRLTPTQLQVSAQVSPREQPATQVQSLQRGAQGVLPEVPVEAEVPWLP